MQEEYSTVDLIAPAEPESSKEPLLTEASSGEVSEKLPGYRLVNLLGFDFSIAQAGAGVITFKAPKGAPTPVYREQGTYRSAGFNQLEDSFERKLTLDCCGFESDFPEPEPDVFYLVEGEFYEKIKFNHNRADLIPVYLSAKYHKDSLHGFYVGS